MQRHFIAEKPARTVLEPATGSADETENFTVENYNLDTDGDDMPDGWEMEKFGSLSQTRDGDYDGDISSNYEEYVAGTDSTDPGSFFAVMNIEKKQEPLQGNHNLEQHHRQILRCILQ